MIPRGMFRPGPNSAAAGPGQTRRIAPRARAGQAPSPAARVGAAALALLAFGTVAAQVPITAAELGASTGEAVWRLLGFFTILTALLAGAAMALVAAGFRVGDFALGGVALHEVFLGLVYYALLARDRDLAGWPLLVDTALHAALPAGMLLWWAAFAPKAGLRARHALLWTLWPALYSLYALGRGAATGWYPYFFLDVAGRGAGFVALQVAGLTAAVALLGLGLVALARPLGATQASSKL